MKVTQAGRPTRPSSICVGCTRIFDAATGAKQLRWYDTALEGRDITISDRARFLAGTQTAIDRFSLKEKNRAGLRSLDCAILIASTSSVSSQGQPDGPPNGRRLRWNR